MIENIIGNKKVSKFVYKAFLKMKTNLKNLLSFSKLLKYPLLLLINFKRRFLFPCTGVIFEALAVLTQYSLCVDNFSVNLWWSLIARLRYNLWISVQDALMSPARIKKMHCSSSVFNLVFIKNSLNFLEFCEIVSVGEMCF